MNKQNICKIVLERLQQAYSEQEIIKLLEKPEQFSHTINEILINMEVETKIKKYKKRFPKSSKWEKNKKILEFLINANEKRVLIYEGSGPHYSTGINFLADIMGQIRGKLVDGYKKLTTDYSQRRSYKIHILNGIVNMFATEFINSGELQKIPNADLFFNRVKKLEDKNSNFSSAEGKEIKTGKENKKEMVLKIDKQSKEDTEKLRFIIDGEDLTGANAAYDVFRQIKKQILDKYNLLGNQQDKQDFYKYLIANVEAELNYAEEELRADLPEEKVKQIYKNMPDNAKEQQKEPEQNQGMESQGEELEGMDVAEEEGVGNTEQDLPQI